MLLRKSPFGCFTPLRPPFFMFFYLNDGLWVNWGLGQLRLRQLRIVFIEVGQLRTVLNCPTTLKSILSCLTIPLFLLGSIVPFGETTEDSFQCGGTIEDCPPLSHLNENYPQLSHSQLILNPLFGETIEDNWNYLTSGAVHYLRVPLKILIPKRVLLKNEGWYFLFG